MLAHLCFTAPEMHIYVQVAPVISAEGLRLRAQRGTRKVYSDFLLETLLLLMMRLDAPTFARVHVLTLEHSFWMPPDMSRVPVFLITFLRPDMMLSIQA